MFIPNKFGQLFRQGPRDVFGQTSELAPVRVPLGVVRLAKSGQQTTVRADSSASQGAAREMVADCVVLVPGNVALNFGDSIAVDAVKFKINGVQPRYSVSGGLLDHFEVSGSIDVT